MGLAGSWTLEAAVVLAVVGPLASTTVPQDWHSPQRPTHLAVVQPHSVQRKALAVREPVFLRVAMPLA